MSNKTKINLLDIKLSDYSIPFNIVFWTGVIISAVPIVFYMIIVMIFGMLLQIFYLIRYPLDIYLWNLCCHNKKQKPKIKVSFIFE